MLRKLASAIIVLLLVFGLASAVYADLSVGVKKGDWIEYTVTTTGTPTAGHNVNSSRLEVTDIQGTNITVYITSTLSDGSTKNFNSTLILQTGHLIDDFIIPANLNAGDSFLDDIRGIVTINSSDQHTYAGAIRTVLTSTSGQNTYIWDKATGVSVEATSVEPEYTMHTIVKDTNMWQPSEAAGGLDATALVLVAVVVVIAIVVAALLAFRYQKKKMSQ